MASSEEAGKPRQARKARTAEAKAEGSRARTPASRPAGTMRGHSIADHALGALAAHVHAPGEEHDHDHDHDGMDLLAAGAADDVTLTSIGIDIGSSGTQVAFARLTLERAETPSVPAPSSSATPGAAEPPGEGSARRATRRRETLHQSPVYLTPYVGGDRIDEAALGRLIDHAFAGAGLTADEIDCGVVILTGAARQRDNAEAIGRRLAETCGDIVSASAGHHMEARLAAHGSGAVARSVEFGQRYLSVDIGGATTKLAICERGAVVATAALAIGGRLVATDKTDRIVRLEPAGQQHAASAGLDWREGGLAPWPQRQAVGRRMASLLVAALTGSLGPAAAAALYVTEPLVGLAGIEAVIVSGGVGEYVYGRESRSFSDLGLPLGRALAGHIDRGELPWPLLPAAECIRATVLGASSYSVQLSGRTGSITDPAGLLPRRNLPVVEPVLALGETIDPAAVAHAVAKALRGADLDDPAATAAADCVLALRWQGAPEHSRLAALARGLRRGSSPRQEAGHPLYIVTDGDIAASLGAVLREVGVTTPLLVLDGIALSDLDYIDLGRIRLPSGAVPVTIKTLVFRDEPQHKSRRSRARSPRSARSGERE